jgi:hypothetical protein
MRVIPSSPRTRRRVTRLGIALAIVGAITGILVLVRGPKAPSASPAKNAPPAQLVKQSKHVSPADRRAIDKTLDQFIPAALGGRSPETAWRLAGPELRGGTTLRQWRHGTSPIPYYPARGKTFHSWTTVDAGPTYVDFSLLVHPRHGPKGSSEVFSGQMLKQGDRWVVNGLYTIAVFARPDKKGRHEVGPADFAAGPAASGSGQGAPPPSGHSASLGKVWLLAIAGVIFLVLLLPLGLGVASVIRSRRARQRYNARSEARALPPLPRSGQGASEPAAEAGAGGPRH